MLSFLDPENDCKEAALYALKERKSDAIGKASIQFLSEPKLQLMAAEAIENNPTEEAVEPLVDMLNSQDLGCRGKAASSLGEIGGLQSLTALRKAFEKEKDSWVRGHIAEAIKKASRKQ